MNTPSVFPTVTIIRAKTTELDGTQHYVVISSRLGISRAVYQSYKKADHKGKLVLYREQVFASERDAVAYFHERIEEIERV